MSHNLCKQLSKIDVDDLEYVERDLSFYELVSLGFLLFGDDRTNAEFVLQKLLVLANTQQSAAGNAPADLLRKYASLNPTNWRAHLVEALAIIGSRRVLRQLGFQWAEVRLQYLPHIAELSVHVHPLLKALYKMCERLTPADVGGLILQINEQFKQPEEHLRFYDSAYLEIFLLDWLTRKIISLGDREANGADLQVLLSYFKLHEMDAVKTLLIDTINSNADRKQPPAKNGQEADTATTLTTDDNSLATPIANVRTCELESSECYTVCRSQAGIILIINQRNFYEETDEKWKCLLPKKKLKERCGTDVDKERLKLVFSEFGFTPVEHDNLNHINLLHCIRETVKRSLLLDSLIVCILSHGKDGAVYGNNSIPVDIADIEQIITGDTLLGKPKMLIIQACQKDEAPAVMTDKRKASSYLAVDAYADVIRAMCTVPGYPAMRHTTEGTWFIQALCDAVHKLGDNKHMLDILVAVNRDVTNKRGANDEKMVTMTSNTLRKYFFLPPRL